MVNSIDLDQIVLGLPCCTDLSVAILIFHGNLILCVDYMSRPWVKLVNQENLTVLYLTK